MYVWRLLLMNYYKEIEMGLYKDQEKYDKQNTMQIRLKLNLKTDADILEFLEKSGNKQGTIKKLIRQEIERSQGD